jgi:chorismate mutase / prephenate dehydratase
MPMTVAYPGEEGAYAAEAGARLYPDAELRSFRSWAEVVRAVGRGEAGYGVLPIENSLAGAIPETYDVLTHAPVAIVAETVLPVPHCLVGLPGTNIDGLARVHSHPAALAQCRRFLSSLPDTLPEVAPSTATAARRVADAGDRSQAAISSRRAATRFGLTVLLNDVSDHAENYTRFVSVATHTRIDRNGARLWHTAVRFVTHHHPGALLSAIEPLARYGVNMASLQSRPIPGRPWNYQFYADLEGHPLDAAVSTALRALEENVAEIGYLGCYPAFDRAE